jgi:hypothetical protein
MEEIAPREVGREGMLEKKRARRDADRDFRDKGDDGLEADESTLLGGGDSFKAQCVECVLPVINSYISAWPELRSEMLHENDLSRNLGRKRRFQQYVSEPRCIKRKKRYEIKQAYTYYSTNSATVIKATMDMFQQMAKRFG